MAENESHNNTYNPFPGLRPFKFDEAHLFFGREGQTDEVLWKLSQNKFVGIIGPSGAGKSSFVFCGVIPMLYGGYISTQGEDWDIIVFRPGGNPILNLAKALLQKEPDYRDASPKERKLKQKIVETYLKSSSGNLSEAVNDLKSRSGNNYLILVDQFEELFRFKDSAEEKGNRETYQFIELLMEAIDDPLSPVHVALTMRSEFIGNCSQFPELTRKINDSHFLIPQLTREQKKKVIEGPVSVAGGKISPTLVQRLLNDIGDQKDQLPVLQHALMRTWDYWLRSRKANEPMEIKHYEAVGTITEALSIHADEAFKELNDRQRDICEVLFKSITEKKGNFGIRRPTTLREISKLSNASEEEIIEVVEKFREPGRSLLTPPVGVTLRAASIIDISHESLMRIWRRLQGWVEEEAESVSMYLRMADAAAKYQEGLSGLWRPPDLQLGLNWQLKNKPTLDWGIRYHPAYERTMSFLEYSKKEYDNEEKMKEIAAKRRLRAARITVGILASATLISISFLVYALSQRTVAINEAQEALIQRDRASQMADSAMRATQTANKQRIIAEQQTDLAEKRREIALTAQKRATLERDSANIARDTAQAAQYRANLARIKAQEEELKAIVARDSANIARREEAAQRRRAEELRFSDLSATIGLKAAQNIPDLQLKGLLAAQSYNFNKKYNGSPYNPAVYTGLHAALTAFNDPVIQDIPWKGNDEIKAFANDPTRTTTYAAGTTGEIVAWDWQGDTFTERNIAPARSSEEVHEVEDMAVSADGKFLIAVGKFSRLISDPKTDIEVYTLPSGTPKRIQGLDNDVQSIAMAKNPGFAYLLDNNGKSIKSLDISGGTFSRFITPEVELKDIATDPNGIYVVGAGVDGNIYIWDQASGTLINTIKSTRGVSLTTVKFSPDSKFLAAGFDNGGVLLFNSSFQQLYEYTDHTTTIYDIGFNKTSNGSTFMSTASRDKYTRVWDLVDLTNAPIVLGDGNSIFFSTTFTPNNHFILAGSSRGRVKKYPSSLSPMGSRICNYLERNMTEQEWKTNIATDVPFENTCVNLALNED